MPGTVPSSCLTQGCSLSSFKFSSNFYSLRSSLKWHFHRESFRVSSSPPRSGCQDRIRHARDLLEDIPVEDKKEEARVSRESLRFQGTSDIYWRRRRKENWLEKDCSTLLRKFWLGKWGVPKSELPIRRVLCPAGSQALASLQCSVTGWPQFSRDMTSVPNVVVDPERQQLGLSVSYAPHTGDLSSAHS